jgi:hypothetical protein
MRDAVGMEPNVMKVEGTIPFAQIIGCGLD